MQESVLLSGILISLCTHAIWDIKSPLHFCYFEWIVW